MPRSASVDGFSLAYERHGAGPPVVLLHGWPGDRHDWREVVAALGDEVTAIVPDLRGFGESDKPPREPSAFGAAGQAAAVQALLGELGYARAVLAGYDVGSRTAQELAREAPDTVTALVLAPPLPGIGRRVLDVDAQAEFWYQSFHQLALCPELIDGDRDAVRSYLRHFWSHWAGPSFVLSEDELERLTALYAAPGAFTASINWYRSGAGTVARSLTETAPDPAARIAAATTVLWPERDPLFPPAWADRLGEFFADVEVSSMAGIGHFSPLEAPERFADAIRAAAGL